MRRSVAALAAVAALAVAFATPASAKFGMTKTKVTLKRMRPPEVALVGETVTVEVVTRLRGLSDRSLDGMRQRVEEAIRAGGALRFVDDRADCRVAISVDDVDARVDDSIVYEDKYVQTGTKQEWNEKKKKYEEKAVYGNRKEPVHVHTAGGKLVAAVSVKTPLGEHTADVAASYSNTFKGDARIPSEAATESELERYLVEQAADKAAAVVAFTQDPVEALLAVDGELKDGNKLAQAGLWKEALASWTARTFKGDKEAARQHNVGVAHEALAYGFAPDGPEHQAELDQAADSYKKALALDPGEKYFSEPIPRIQVSLGYADTARRLAADVQHWKEEGVKKQAEARAKEARVARAAAPDTAKAPAPTAPARPSRPAVKKPAPAAPPEPETGLGGSASLALPLRNGSFESALAPWKVAGRGTVVDGGRGKVLQAIGGSAAPTTVSQPVSVDVSGASAANVSLEYKVAAGPASARLFVVYADDQGRSRTSSVELAKGDNPGDWTPAGLDLAALKPKAARVKEVRIVVEDGTVLLDNVALTVR